MNTFIRRAEKKDKLLLFNWFNKPDSLKQKIDTKNPITIEKHYMWFKERLSDSDTYIWIIENEINEPLGQIRFQKGREEFYDIDIYIVEAKRKMGIASEALFLAEEEKKVRPLRAIVKNSNRFSRLFFLKCGYNLTFNNKDFSYFVKC